MKEIEGKKMAENNYPFLYSSTELSKYFGITIKGIEYYEKESLISPHRVGTEKERRFNLADTYRLFLSRYYKQAGFSIKEIRSLLNQNQIKQVATSIKKQENKLQQQEIWLQAVNSNLDRVQKLLIKVRNSKSIFEYKDCPAFKRLFLRKLNGPHLENSNQAKEYKYWNKLMPITNGGLFYSCRQLLKRESYLSPEVDMLITKENFKNFHFNGSNRVTDIASKKCLHTILIGDANKIGKINWLLPALNKLKADGNHLTGNVLTSILFVKHGSNKDIRYDEAWLPIEK